MDTGRDSRTSATPGPDLAGESASETVRIDALAAALDDQTRAEDAEEPAQARRALLSARRSRIVQIRSSKRVVSPLIVLRSFQRLGESRFLIRYIQNSSRARCPDLSGGCVRPDVESLGSLNTPTRQQRPAASPRR